MLEADILLEILVSIQHIGRVIVAILGGLLGAFVCFAVVLLSRDK